MKKEEIYEWLCWHDPRKPDTSDIEDEEDRIEPRQENCSCTPCFHGTDKLAIKLLEFMEPQELEMGGFIKIGEYIGGGYEWEGPVTMYAFGGDIWANLCPEEEFPWI